MTQVFLGGAAGEVAYYMGLDRQLALAIFDIPNNVALYNQPLTQPEIVDHHRGRIFRRTLAQVQNASNANPQATNSALATRRHPTPPAQNASAPANPAHSASRYTLENAATAQSPTPAFAQQAMRKTSAPTPPRPRPTNAANKSTQPPSRSALTPKNQDQRLAARAILYTFEAVRMYNASPAIAGVAITISFNEFFPSNSNLAPADTTKVSPSSLNKYNFPFEAHGDAVNAAAAGSIRCFPNISFPVLAS